MLVPTNAETTGLRIEGGEEKNLAAGSLEANRNSAEIRNPYNLHKTQDITFSNRN
jgi:hypothetical protein